MSHMNRGLFDPRRPMVHFPEPNDDPNIPYVWGLSGYPSTMGAPAAPPVTVRPTPAPIVQTSDNTALIRLAAGASLVLGTVGFFEKYSASTETSQGLRIWDSAANAVIYATGIGFVAAKMKG